MIQIENTEVVGLEHAIRGMRNPMNSWDKSDSEWLDFEEWDCGHGIPNGFGYAFVAGENDLGLMNRLVDAGTDHRKFMRMIVVYLDITAPLYWWKEFDTYKVGTVANSCSTMHKIQDKEFTMDDFSCEHLVSWECNDNGEDFFVPSKPLGLFTAKGVLELTIDSLNHYRGMFNVADKQLKREDLTEVERKRIVNQRKHYWWQMIQLLPSSYNQKRTVMLNYEVLANMYHSRKSHKLDEWREFCEWIKTLPYSELITK